MTFNSWLFACLFATLPLTVEHVAAQEPEAFKIERSSVLTIDSKSLGHRYEVYVKTPPGYELPENRNKTYPALYMTDGAYTFEVASGVTMVPFTHKRLSEFILVGISNAVGEPPNRARSLDLTPWPSPAQSEPTGGAGAYFGFVKKELIPTVESRFRIDPRQRVLVGQSYGALFGLWVAFTDPSLFGGYILTSPSIWFAERAILQQEVNYARSHKDLEAKIYMATGQMEFPGSKGCSGCRNDMVADQKHLADTLRSRKYPGLELRNEVIEGTYHETTFPVGLIKALQWMFPSTKS